LVAHHPRRTALSISALLLAVLTSCTTTHPKTSADAAHPSGTRSSGTSSDSSAGPSGAVTLAQGAGPQKKYTAQAQPSADSCHYRYDHDQPLPDAGCTPGAVSPAVTQATLATTICRSGGYTGGIRPPGNITDKEKAANAKSYGYTGPLHDAEYDHLISLQLGGDPNDPRNLWVEPPSPGHKAGAGPNNPKDAVETRLHTAICKNQVTLVAAQQAIATDWETAEQVLGLKPDPGDASGSSD
jgi:hypothetical protein